MSRLVHVEVGVDIDIVFEELTKKDSSNLGSVS